MRFLSRSQLEQLIRRLAETKTVYLPYRTGERINYHRYDGNVDHDALAGIRPTSSLKNFLFPPSEFVASFPKEVRKSIPEQIVIGPKQCDIYGVWVYDRIFGQGEFQDPFYLERKKQLFLISVDCPTPAESCFCNLVDLTPWVEAGSDLNLTPLDDGYLIDPVSKRGKEFLESKGLGSEPTEGQLKAREESRKRAMARLEEINRGKRLREQLPDDDEFWMEKLDGCVECFSCLFACPTCYCFLLYDVKAKKGFDRIRVWDACYYAAYARVGGGMNPRPDFLSRFKNRFHCKFEYFKQYHDRFACSGCGRCLKGCSANIDIREIVWQ
ncbi:hypothetical protein DRP53_00255 [candidate division WOR-3 bacterium]|uniref:4Fe-4S ferredoxin-type domain-containing protein n=1 Tax=candidate division WOR-3 bacterium TaxID=2052148 RepID=A0A660SM60_UNCW3|nr:MAG: hypothetical protein DRP53_00255 [candidate division WOR-3 bacterium]